MPSESMLLKILCADGNSAYSCTALPSILVRRDPIAALHESISIVMCSVSSVQTEEGRVPLQEKRPLRSSPQEHRYAYLHVSDELKLGQARWKGQFRSSVTKNGLEDGAVEDVIEQFYCVLDVRWHI